MMNKKKLLLTAIGGLSAFVANAALEIIQVDRLGLSSSEPTQAITQVAVQAGDVIVWSHASNKKASVVTMTFGVSVGGTIVVNEFGLVTDPGTDAGLTFNVISAASVIGGDADPNPNPYIAWLTMPEGGTYDFWASSNANLTASDMLYIVRSTTGGSVDVLPSRPAEQYAADADTVFSLGYAWDAAYESVAIIEAVCALKGSLEPTDATIDWSNENDGGDPPTYLPGLRVHASMLVPGTTGIGSSYNYAQDPANAGKNSFGAVGISLGESGGGGGDTWHGYPIAAQNWVDTGAWMGWVNITYDPWVWVEVMGKYIYTSGDSGWVYIMK